MLNVTQDYPLGIQERQVSSDSLISTPREQNAHAIFAVVHRALARAELLAPAAAQGAFIAVGATFDAFQAIGKVLNAAKRDVMIVDPYMDERALTDFVPLVPEGIRVRLLRDSAYSKLAASLKVALARWVQQYGAARPVEARETAPKGLHDRLSVIDVSIVWILTQSLRDFAGRSPASVSRVVDGEAERLKIDAYDALWFGSQSV